MRKQFFAVAVMSVLAAGVPALAQETPSPEGAKVYFVNIEEGAVVTSPFKVVFGLSGMGVAPAGTEKENTGHHHLLIDRPALGEGEGGADELIYGLPADENHVHFGGGQTEKMVELPAGTHTLQLVLGDLGHVPHSPPVMSEVITITALLHKSGDGRGSPIPGRTHPTASVTGMPSAVKPFRTATRTWNSDT